MPLGIALVLWLTPGYVLAESRERAQEAMDRGVLSRSLPARIATIVIILTWLLALALSVWLVLRIIHALTASQHKSAERARPICPNSL